MISEIYNGIFYSCLHYLLNSNFSLTGWRVVSIMYLFEPIHICHNGNFGCSFIDMEFISENIKGFHSIFFFLNVEFVILKKKICSKKVKQECMSVNKAVVNACHAIGYNIKNICNIFSYK